MAITDDLFGIHAAALQVQSRRMELIASNIANADTPGYAARDIDFAQAMAQAAADGTSSAALPADGMPEPAERKALQPSQDGNSVDMQTEQAAYADAALHYQASMSFVDARLKTLLAALTGQ